MAMRLAIDPETGELRELQDENGWEIPDPEPVAIPSGFKRPETLAEQVRRLVRSERFNEELKAAGVETFDEADDFEVDEDFDPSTPFETFFDPVLGKDITPMEFKEREAEYRDRYVKAQAAFFDQVDRDNIMAENLVRSRARKPAEPPKSGGDGGAPPSPSSPKEPS